MAASKAQTGALEGVEASTNALPEPRALGIPDQDARSRVASQKGYWRVAGSWPLQTALPNAYGHKTLGLKGFTVPYRRFRECWANRPVRTRMPGGVGGAGASLASTRFVEAFENRDVRGLVALMTDDALLTMPPQPLEYQGHTAIAEFLAGRFATHSGRRAWLVPTRANSQPAFGHYIEDAHAPIGRFFGVLVLILEGDHIIGLARFGDTAILPLFGLPRTIVRERAPS